MSVWISAKGLWDEFLPPGSTMRRFIAGSFWTFAGTGLSSLATLSASVICSRWLGRVGFGQMNALVSTVGLFALIAGMGIGLTATKFIAEYRETQPARIGRILAMLEAIIILTLLVTGAVLLCSADWLAGTFFNDASLAPYFRISVLWLAGFVYVEVGMSALAGFEAFFDIAAVQCIRAVVLIFATWGGLHWWGLAGAIWALVISVLVSSYLVNRRLQSILASYGIVRCWRGAMSEIGLIWRYSLPAVATGLVVLPFTFCSNGLIARSVGMRDLGLLNAVNQWRGILTFLPVNFSKVALAILANRHGVEKGSFRSFEISNWFNQLLLWPAALFLMFCARDLLGLNGREFADGVLVMQIMIGGTALGFVGNVFGTMIQSRGWFGVGLAGNFLTGASISILTWLFVDSIGAESMSWGYFVGYALNFILCGYIVTGHLGLSRMVWRKMLAAGACMAVATLLACYTGGNCPWPWALLVAFIGSVIAGLVFMPDWLRAELSQRYLRHG